MRPRLAYAVGGLVLTLALRAGATGPDPALEARVRQITGELRCLVCQNQTIADSHAALAEDLRREVRELLQRGATDDEVRRYMTDRYGDFVLYKPPLRATTALLWAGPGVLLLAGGIVLLRALRRRARLPADAFEPEPDDPAAEARP